MADPRWLQDTVSCAQHEGRALVLVNELDLARAAVDQLEPDAVEVHPVGDRAAARDRDVRSDEATALSVRDQVAVAHAGAPRPPRTAAHRAHDERGADGWNHERGLGRG